MAFDYDEYLRVDRLPHIWCPGCGHGIIFKAMLRAIHTLSIEKDDVMLVSGIGCASRLPGYADFNTLHTTHGRALPFATGIKVVKPHLNVIITAGSNLSAPKFAMVIFGSAACALSGTIPMQPKATATTSTT